ncbi:MAG: hypothetical protein AAF614_44170, partial [Chloroflexota bacterium]
LKNYLESEHYKILRQVFVHLIASREERYITSQYTSVYTGFECLVNGLAEYHEDAQLLKNNEHKRIVRKLKPVIDSQITNEDVAQNVKDKLGELRRRAFKDKLKRLIGRYKLEINNLWPCHLDPLEELYALVNRRNIYLHQGFMENVRVYAQDRNRLQLLLELWILKLLDCPNQSINHDWSRYMEFDNSEYDRSKVSQISKTQVEALKKKVKEVATLASQHHLAIYSKLHNHFKVARYTQIPQKSYSTVFDFLDEIAKA